MKKIFVLLLLMLFAFGLVAQAQESLTAGEPVSGEITEDMPEVEYTYDAEEGEVVVIELFPVDILGDYDQPAIVIVNDAGEEVVRRESFGNTTLAWMLEEAGTYTIIASRADETSVGEYTLTVRNPEEIMIGDTVTGTANADEAVYYVYRGEADFNIFFSRSGEFAPEVSVNTINTTSVPGTFNTMGAALGSEMDEMAMGVFPGDEVYVIAIKRAIFDFVFGEPTVDYSLEIFEPGT